MKRAIYWALAITGALFLARTLVLNLYRDELRDGTLQFAGPLHRFMLHGGPVLVLLAAALGFVTVNAAVRRMWVRVATYPALLLLAAFGVVYYFVNHDQVMDYDVWTKKRTMLARTSPPFQQVAFGCWRSSGGCDSAVAHYEWNAFVVACVKKGEPDSVADGVWRVYDDNGRLLGKRTYAHGTVTAVSRATIAGLESALSGTRAVGEWTPVARNGNGAWELANYCNLDADALLLRRSPAGDSLIGHHWTTNVPMLVTKQEVHRAQALLIVKRLDSAGTPEARVTFVLDPRSGICVVTGLPGRDDTLFCVPRESRELYRLTSSNCSEYDDGEGADEGEITPPDDDARLEHFPEHASPGPCQAEFTGDYVNDPFWFGTLIFQPPQGERIERCLGLAVNGRPCAFVLTRIPRKSGLDFAVALYEIADGAEPYRAFQTDVLPATQYDLADTMLAVHNGSVCIQYGPEFACYKPGSRANADHGPGLVLTRVRVSAEAPVVSPRGDLEIVRRDESLTLQERGAANSRAIVSSSGADKSWRIGRAVWSPDGDAVYFDNGGANGCIWECRTANARVRKIVPFHDAAGPEPFDAGGVRHVLYIRGGALYDAIPPAEIYRGDRARDAVAQVWTMLPLTCNGQGETFAGNLSFDGMSSIGKSVFKVLPFRTLGIIAGVPVFLSGPHGDAIEENSRTSFGHYNPAFVKWLTANLIPGESAGPVFQASVVVYDRVRPLARAFYAAYRKIKDNPECFEQLKKAYQAKLESGSLIDNEQDNGELRSFLSDTYCGKSVEALPAAVGGDAYVTIVPFWMRRSIDGTFDEFGAALEKLLTTYDPEVVRR